MGEWVAVSALNELHVPGYGAFQNAVVGPIVFHDREPFGCRDRLRGLDPDIRARRPAALTEPNQC